MRLLIVEDAEDVAEAIALSLGRAGFACDVAGRLEAGDELLRLQDYDAVVLDIHLPDGSGRDLLRAMRGRGDRTPVLMLTAEYEVTARVDALNEGADDFLVKPFDLRELEARLRALARREGGRASNLMALGALVVDPAARTVRRDGELVPLTRRELALLNLLAAHRGRIVAKDRLFDGLFAFDQDEVGVNAVELYVARLRKKLAGSGVSIETHRGLGYRLEAADG